MEKRVKKNSCKLNKLKKVINTLDENQRTIGLALLERAVFMSGKLKELEDDINANGLTCMMPQGKYEIERANPSFATYNAMIKNYNSTIKQINELLPVGEVESELENDYF